MRRRKRVRKIKLSSLAEFIGEGAVVSEKTVYGLACDSRRCENGYLFFCKGNNFKTEYALEAEKKGACAFVCEDRLFANLEKYIDASKIITTSSVSRAMAECACRFYGYPMKKLISIAVTGTKGKTTVTHYISSAINMQDNMKCAILSDLVSKDAPHLTTPEAIDFQEAAARAVEEGCTHIACEISSQAQKCERAFGVEFDFGCFLNLGYDHISPSEHKSIDEYFECKRSLFSACKTAIVNIDGMFGKMLYDSLPTKCKRISVSTSSKSCDYYAENIRIDACGCDMTVCDREKGGRFPIVASTPGEYNISNALLASATAKAVGVGDKAIFFGIASGLPSGRCEFFTTVDKKITVIVDYAHNEMSFKAMFGMAKKEFAGATVTAIFGCPGEKAYCRRGQLARICADNADKVIICEDDSGFEGYESISKEMLGYFEALDGMRLNLAAVSCIKSRELALENAVKNASEADGKHLILFLGKGDERLNRVCGCDETCICDIEIAKREIEKYNKSVPFISEISKYAKNESIMVCIENETLLSSFAFACTELLGGGIGFFAVCESNLASRLCDECFKCGVSALIINADETEKAVAISKTVKNIGILPIFSCKSNARRYSAELASACCAKKLVYLSLGAGILFKGKSSPKKLSYRRARLISGAFYEESLVNAETAIEHGVNEVAYIDCASENAFLRYLTGDFCNGMVVCGE